MALKRPMTLPNGAECEYHRVENPELDFSTLAGKFRVGHYLSEAHARLTRSPSWVTEISGFVASRPETVQADAYAALKVLPGWEEAEDA